jgi:hypothetical protein
MDFRKIIDIPESELRIDYHSKLVMLGSCFAENIGRRLSDNKFTIDVNPFGVLYNPASIQQGLKVLLDEKVFSESDLFHHKGLFHSFYHHSLFSGVEINDVLTNINKKREEASLNLKNADILLVTFGTAYVYQNKDTDKVVGNCHKLPAAQFNRYRLSVKDIVDDWSLLIDRLREINSKLKFLFTVSPIRHWKDGVHGNQLSKSTLLLAIDELSEKYRDIFYFPSYELLLDELRDYRFYAQDMLHPSDVAIQYIWEKFEATYLNKETQTIVNQWENVKRAIDHRPFNEGTPEHKHFLRQTLLKLETLRNNYPYFECEKEIQLLKNRLSL